VSDFVDVREPVTDKLLFRYDADRDIIEVQRRGVRTLVDLRQYQERQGAPDNETNSRAKEDCTLQA
jgi:protein tyrosine phosphatase (PTP) superfamily phosphohydrolase (DUF442 family)